MRLIALHQERRGGYTPVARASNSCLIEQPGGCFSELRYIRFPAQLCRADSHDEGMRFDANGLDAERVGREKRRALAGKGVQHSFRTS